MMLQAIQDELASYDLEFQKKKRPRPPPLSVEMETGMELAAPPRKRRKMDSGSDFQLTSDDESPSLFAKERSRRKRLPPPSPKLDSTKSELRKWDGLLGDSGGEE